MTSILPSYDSGIFNKNEKKNASSVTWKKFQLSCLFSYPNYQITKNSDNIWSSIKNVWNLKSVIISLFFKATECSESLKRNLNLFKVIYIIKFISVKFGISYFMYEEFFIFSYNKNGIFDESLPFVFSEVKNILLKKKLNIKSIVI